MLLALAGDAMLGRLVDEHIIRFGPEYPLIEIEPVLNKADFALVNLECTIAESGAPFPGRAFYFRAHPLAAKVLKQANISCVSLANNHILDFGPDALAETIKRLDAAGIAHAGAGKNIREAGAPAIVNVGNMRIGVLSFADHFEGYAAGTEPGINYTEIATEGEHWERIKRLVAEARFSVDLLIFSIHWGPNMRQRPTKEFVEFAHAVMDLGVDVYHGHSAHIFQGIEIYGGKPIFYDTGELVDDYYVGPGETNDQQLLFLIEVEGKEISGIRLVPIHINLCRAQLAKNKIYDEIYERVRALSAGMGTKIIRKNSSIEVAI